MADPPLAARLHSRRDPQAEADRYVEALGAEIQGADFFILIEPGAGYLIESLRKRHPGGKPLILRADPLLNDFNKPGVPAWHSGSGKSLQAFLESEIPEGSIARVVQWRPSLAVYGEACLALLRESAAFLKRAKAGELTAAAFGPRWTRNFFRNLSRLNVFARIERMNAPVVIAGAGPSLEAALNEIRRSRDGIFLIAASSALAALAAGGIAPDLAICTDGGGWALMHMRAFGLEPPPAKALACALCAALPSQCARTPALALSDGSLWQSIALKAAGVPSAFVPQRGTVTASALELALSLSSGPIFFAGADFAIADVKSHARPYGFDHLFFGSAFRLRPHYAQAFERSLAMREGGSHDIYAQWFKARIESLRGRVFALEAGNGIFERRAKIEGARSGLKIAGVERLALPGLPAQRAEMAARAIEGALADRELAPRLTAELGPLLFAGERGASARDVAGKISNITRRYARRP